MNSSEALNPKVVIASPGVIKKVSHLKKNLLIITGLRNSGINTW